MQTPNAQVADRRKESADRRDAIGNIQEDENVLLEYWRSITKRKWAILFFGLMVALLAGVVVFAMTPIYQSTATVMIEVNKAKLLSIEDVYPGISQNREYFQTQVEIIKSREVAIKAIMITKLWDYPEFDPRQKKQSLLTPWLAALGLGKTSVPKDWNETTLAEAIYPHFSGRLTVEPVRQSQLAKISFAANSPALAALVANAIALTYIENDLDTRFKVTRQASNWLQDRLSSLKTKLDDSERALQSYRERTGIVDVKSVSQSGAGKQIEDITLRVVEARMRRAEAENAYNQIKAATKGEDLSSLPAVVRNSTVAEAKRQEAEAERKLAELSQRYGHEHPRFIQAEAELKAARDNTRRQVDTVVASVTREYEVARGTEKSLEGTLNAARGAVQSLNRKEFELGVLEREVESNRQIYDMFMKRAKETNVSGDLQTAVARVVDAAVMPGAPVKPQKMQIIAIAFVLGLISGILISLLLDRLDNTLKSSEDVESKLKYPVLTTLPLLGKSVIGRTPAARLFLDDPQSLYSEAIRTARTGVLLSAIDLPNRVLLVTSSLSGEGKTTFAINLAMAHAHTKKTLLIDADMRSPAIANGLDFPLGCKGLSNLVSGTAELKECVHTIGGTNLRILTSGTIPPNPIELLLSNKFSETLVLLSTIFDIIIIDSPPVELVSDALVISPQATGVIYMVKANDTPYQLARKGLQRVRRAGGQVMGVVLNQLDFIKAEKYHGEYSGYGKYGSQKYGAPYGGASGGTQSPSKVT